MFYTKKMNLPLVCQSHVVAVIIIIVRFISIPSVYSFVPSSSLSCHRHPSYKYHSTIRFTIIHSNDFEFSSCIGKGSYLEFQDRGHGLFSTSLLVQGTLIGNISMEDEYEDTKDTREKEKEDTMIFVEQGGVIQSNLTNVHTVIINGQIRGDISCVKLIVGSTGIVLGNIDCSSLQVEPGATIIGKIDCSITKFTETITNQQPLRPSSHHYKNKLQEDESKIQNNNNHNPINRSLIKPLQQDDNGLVGKQGHDERSPVSINTQVNPSITSKNGSATPIQNNGNIIPSTTYNSGNGLPLTHRPNTHKNDPVTTAATITTSTSPAPAAASSAYKSTSSGSVNFNGIKKELWNNNIPLKRNFPFGGSTTSIKTPSSIPRFPTNAIPIMLSKNEKAKHQDSTSSHTNVNLDNFGNPLFRGADHQQISSFRHYRELSKEMRNLIDLHQRNLRLKTTTSNNNGNHADPTTTFLSVENIKNKKLLLQRSKEVNDSNNNHDGDSKISTIPPFLR